MAEKPELLRAYLIVGADGLKRERAVTRLKGRLDEGLADFNLDEQTASSDLVPEQLISSLQTMPFGAGFRLVIIHEAEKLPKATSEAIVSYLDDPNPSAVLCVVAESLSRGTRLYKALAAQGAKAVIDCAPMKRRDLPLHVQKMAGAHGIELDRMAAEELVSRVGESTLMLDNQLKTLAEHLGAGAVAGRADVERLIARTAEVKPWDLLDSLCARDVTRALEVFNLMQNPSEVALLSMLTGRVRELICAKSLEERGQANRLADELGRQAWQLKNHLRWSRAFRPGELEDLLSESRTCERILKGTGDSRTAFIAYMLRFAR